MQPVPTQHWLTGTDTAKHRCTSTFSVAFLPKKKNAASAHTQHWFTGTGTEKHRCTHTFSVAFLQLESYKYMVSDAELREHDKVISNLLGAGGVGRSVVSETRNQTC